MDAIEALLTRKSATKLVDPAPGTEHLELVLRAAARAPDHGRLRPWRFIVIQGEARVRFGEVLSAAAKARMPEIADASLSREREKALRAPMLIVVAAAIRPENPKIPETERVLSAGTAAQNLLLALHALGYGAMWRTGDAAYDPMVKRALGLSERDHIVGFIYAGTHGAKTANVEEPDLGPLVVDWAGPSG